MEGTPLALCVWEFEKTFWVVVDPLIFVPSVMEGTAFLFERRTSMEKIMNPVYVEEFNCDFNEETSRECEVFSQRMYLRRKTQEMMLIIISIIIWGAVLPVELYVLERIALM